MMRTFYSFLVTLVTGFFFTVSADPVVINITEPGTGENMFKANSAATEIVITGKINQLDLLCLKQYCRLVEKVDLSAANIMSYSDEDNYIDYNANEMTNALAYTSSLQAVILPKTLTSIQRGAFFKCNSLKSITLPMPALPKVVGNIVDNSMMKSVFLYVPKELLEQYKSTKVSGLRFTNVLPITEKSAGPYDSVVFDDLYGQCYYSWSAEHKDFDPIFYVFYMDNHSDKIINKIEFAYWFDNDKQNVQYITKSNLQLLPGQEMKDGEGFITFETPRDTKAHIITIKPYKINDVEVDLGERVKPFRRYYLEGTYRRPTHFVEIFVNPSDIDSYVKYKTVISSMSKLQMATKQPNRFEFVSYVSNPNSKLFDSDIEVVDQLSKIFRVDSIPRMMLNRNLMTPYGMLNNDYRIKDLSIYTPSLKIGQLTDVYEFLFQRSYYSPAFATMKPTIKSVGDGKFVFSLSGEISKQETRENLFVNLYLVENKYLPDLDEHDSYNDADAPIFQKIVRVLSPVDGFPLKVNEDYSYTFDSPEFDIANYQSGKYKIVASVYNYDPKPYRMSILQSTGLVVEDQRESTSLITATTVQNDGDLSFAVASAQDGTPVSIDWGDGNWVNYTVGVNYSEFKSQIKGKDLKIKGDITKLNCIGNKLTKLDVTSAPQLEVLQAEFNFLTELDLSKSVNLLNVEFFSNSIKEIDITNCPRLVRFVGSGNYISNIDLTKSLELEYFDCARMSRIESLDFSNCHKLKHVIVNECSLSKLEIPSDAPLEELLCEKNRIDNLDLSHFDKLLELNCSNNKLTKFDVFSPVIRTLYAMNNDLREIDLSKARDLKYLALMNNPNLLSIDLSKNPKIETLSLSSCGLSELNVTAQKELNRLWCNSNKISSLDLRNNSKLYSFQVKSNLLDKVLLPTNPDSLAIVSLANNKLNTISFAKCDSLKSIDLGSNLLESVSTDNLKNLQVLNIRNNKIHQLNLSENPKLNMIGIIGNGMTACQLNAIYKQLPKLQKMSAKINLYNGDKKDNAAKTSTTEIAERLNWKPVVKGDGSGCKDDTALSDVFNTSSFAVWKSGGQIHIYSPYDKSLVNIYSIEGKVVRSYSLVSHEVILDDDLIGSYVISCQNVRDNSVKVVKVVF